MCLSTVVQKFSFYNTTDEKTKEKNLFFFKINKMRGATSSMFNDHLHHVTLKIWFKTGSIFEEIFPLDKTTFGDVKYSAVRQFLTNNNNNNNNSNISTYRRSSFNTVATSRNNLSLDEVENYKLISITSKRMVEEDKPLGQLKVKDGGSINIKK